MTSRDELSILSDAFADMLEIMEELLPDDHAALVKAQDAIGRAECFLAGIHRVKLLTPPRHLA